MREDELVGVYEAARPVADVVAGVLRAAGIGVVVFGGLDSGQHPVSADGARVMVRARDAARARQLIDDLDDPPGS